MTVLLFWLCAAFIAYVYAGYPALLAVRARLVRRRSGHVRPAPPLPSVSIVVAARNEAAVIARRVENLLQLDYPSALRQIIVVSDGSDDDTEAVLKSYGSRIDVIALPPSGKAAALNAGVAQADHDIIVFTDARQTFAADALRELARSFDDPHVGAVSGELRLEGEPGGRRSAAGDRRTIDGPAPPRADRRSGADRRQIVQSTIAAAVGLYWRLEKRIRQLESNVDSVIGATGAIYAMRRRLWTPLPAGTVLDDVLAPMRCVLAGHRVVFNARALAFDRLAPNAAVEARRKRRTLAGNYQILLLEPRLLLPWSNRLWLQYVSHKVGRLVVPYALVGLLLTSAVLAGRSTFYAVALAAQGAFYLLAMYGAWLEFDDRRQEDLARTAVAEGSMTRLKLESSRNGR
ncbi:MAG TPA: glycosyltransferase family 2 protein [Vicinamibacterales bacterium]|jgi:cellulose synthase/poly-beta-1,6-N-acetylglucosamine synthase-like glycosyltransferase